MEGKDSLISWNDFQSSTVQCFHNLWNDTDFTDITLATADNKQLSAHKVILGSCSPVLYQLLANKHHERPIILLLDIPYNRLKLLLQYLYTGQCAVKNEELDAFLAMGISLKIAGFMEDMGVKKNEDLDDLIEESGLETDEKDELVEEVNLIEEGIGQLEYEEDAEAILLEQYELDQTEHLDLSQNEQNSEDVDPVDEILNKYSLNGTNVDNITLTDIDQELKEYENIEAAKEKKSTENVGIPVTSIVNEFKQTNNTNEGHTGLFDEVDFNSTYKCKICDYKGKLKTYLSMHMLTKHGKKKCNNCDFTTKHITTLINHKRTQHEGSTFKCEKCNFKASLEANLKVHVLAKHDGATFSCGKCHYIAASPEILMKHIQHHIIPEEQVNSSSDETRNGYLKCTESYNAAWDSDQKFPCDAILKDKNNLRRHIHEVHEGSKRSRVRCQCCEHRTSTRSGMRRHVRSHHPGVDKNSDS